jgi:hypothetical protein
MSIIDKWIQKGIEIGKQEAMKQKKMEGRIITAKEFLFDVIEIRFGEVPEDIKLIIQNTNDIDKLRLWYKKSIKVQSLEEFRKNIE